jgi:hypothetical protein
MALRVTEGSARGITFGGESIMRRLTRTIILAAVVAVLAAAATACGSDDGGTDGGGSAEKQTYTNAQYGFEMTYSDPLSVVTVSPFGEEAYAIAFADKDGAVVDDQYVNGIRVGVLDIGQTIKPADVPKLKDAMTEVLKERVAGMPDGRTTSEVTAIELNGTPGFTLDYRFTMGGEEIACRLTLLIKGSNEFDITETTVAGDWEALSPTLDEAVQSFTVE